MSPAIYWTLVRASQMPLDFTENSLSGTEMLKLADLRFPKRRDEWLLGRWAAKSLVKSISSYQGYSLEELEIRNTHNGAPYIQQPDGAILADCLSISHSHRLAVCALSLGQDLKIGADLEKTESRTDEFIADYFTKEEQGLVACTPVEIRHTAVNLVWSMKESMLKALGVGLHWDSRKVEVRGIEGLYPLMPRSGEWQKMQIGDFQEPGRQWAGWWQCRKDFVITLAGFAGGSMEPASIRLVEKHIGRKFAM
jgi:4'-phosphopantetheinyl transferase